MPPVRPRLSRWTASPAFGIAILLVLAVVLIVRGEPQPSSRPSGRSVVVGSASPADPALPATLVVTDGLVQRRQGSTVRPIALPADAKAISVLTSGAYSVALAVRDGRQRAYGITKDLRVTDLGYADAAIASSYPGAAVVLEQATEDPGRVLVTNSPSPTPGRSGTDSAVPTPTVSRSGGASAARTSKARDPNARASAGATSAADPTSSTSTGPPPVLEVRDYVAQRYDASGHALGPALNLDSGSRIAVDISIGLIVWNPAGVLTGRGAIVQPSPATAILIRPDSSERVIGPFHPLASSADELLVWDAARGEFGLMPLVWVTATTTKTATPSASPTSSNAKRSTTPSNTATASPSVSVSPSTVAATRWFQPTRGFAVTGPASFSPDGASFAAYGQVGNRRRLIVAQVSAVGTNQIEVLALAQPTASPSGSPSGSASATVPITATSAVGSSVSGESPTGKRTSATPSAAPAFEPEGFPVRAPASPVWLGSLVVAVATDGTVIGYQPGRPAASVLDFGGLISSLSAAP